MRNTLLILSLLAFGATWATGPAFAVDPLVGPGKVGEKDEKGHVRGADTGAGPHLHFRQQPAPRADSPDEALAKEQKEKDEKARQEAGAGNTGKSGSEPELQKK